MWVSCSPPIVRVQQRLVINLVGVVSTSTKIGGTHNITLGGNIQKLIHSYQFYVTGSPRYKHVVEVLIQTEPISAMRVCCH